MRGDWRQAASALDRLGIGGIQRGEGVGDLASGAARRPSQRSRGRDPRQAPVGEQPEVPVDLANGRRLGGLVVTGARSWWLEQALALDPGAACPPLAGAVRADVCILGGGYTGLWTALELVERDPGLDVVVLEADICGGGASGRNGGFATAWWDEAPELVERFGPDRALFLLEESEAAVDEIGGFCDAEQLDAHYRRRGFLWAAAAPAQLGAYEQAVAASARLGRPDALRPVDEGECRERIGSPLLLGGAFMAAGASVQPALLARGLRRVALRRGVRIHEGTPVLRVARRGSPLVETPAGRVSAGVVVLATNAWAARWRELRRAILPVASHVVLTEPVPERIERLGWTGGELFCDGRLLVHYAHVTREGRIAFGRGGGTLGIAGRIPSRMHRDERAAAVVASAFRRLFPALADVRLTHSWGGPVDRVPGRLHLPLFGRLGESGAIAYGVGFSGNGVAPSRLAGRILASLALDADDPWARCALVGRPHDLLPPEPLRTLGGLAVRSAVRRKEEREELEQPVGPITRSLAGLASLSVGSRRARGRIAQRTR